MTLDDLYKAWKKERVDDESKGAREGTLGQTEDASATILINRDAHYDNREYLERTFCHELAHVIWASEGHFGEHDEAFIERLGGYIHQFLSTHHGALE